MEGFIVSCFATLLGLTQLQIKQLDVCGKSCVIYNETNVAINETACLETTIELMQTEEPVRVDAVQELVDSINRNTPENVTQLTNDLFKWDTSNGTTELPRDCDSYKVQQLRHSNEAIRTTIGWGVEHILTLVKDMKREISQVRVGDLMIRAWEESVKAGHVETITKMAEELTKFLDKQHKKTADWMEELRGAVDNLVIPECPAQRDCPTIPPCPKIPACPDVEMDVEDLAEKLQDLLSPPSSPPTTESPVTNSVLQKCQVFAAKMMLAAENRIKSGLKIPKARLRNLNTLVQSQYDQLTKLQRDIEKYQRSIDAMHTSMQELLESGHEGVIDLSGVDEVDEGNDASTEKGGAVKRENSAPR